MDMHKNIGALAIRRDKAVSAICVEEFHPSNRHSLFLLPPARKAHAAFGLGMLKHRRFRLSARDLVEIGGTRRRPEAFPWRPAPPQIGPRNVVALCRVSDPKCRKPPERLLRNRPTKSRRTAPPTPSTALNALSTRSRRHVRTAASASSVMDLKTTAPSSAATIAAEAEGVTDLRDRINKGA
jgi:hypothetical protein